MGPPIPIAVTSSTLVPKSSALAGADAGDNVTRVSAVQYRSGAPSSDGALSERKANPGRAKDNLGRNVSNGLAKPVSPIGEQTPTNLPSEAKPKRKRAPNGTFDRKAYQREYMRNRRQKEKTNG